jgi:hypothetical protein
VDEIERFFGNLHGRIGAALSLRLVIQPLVATILAVRAGLRDAREGRAPYGWTIATDASARRDLLREGWKDVGKVFALAVVLDVVYQVMVHRWVYPGETLVVAAVLALVPYVLARGIVTRLARMRSKPSAASR